MSKVFYDRLGRPHAIKGGEKSKSPNENHRSKAEKPKSKGAKSPTGSFLANAERPARADGRPPLREGRFEKKKPSTRSFDDRKRGPKKEFEKNKRRSGPPKTDPYIEKKAPEPTFNPAWTKLKAIVDKNKRGTGYLVFDRADLEDIIIPRPFLEGMFHGDRVEVWVNDESEIEHLKVLEHRFREIFGRIQMDPRSKSRSGYLVYERKKTKEEVYIKEIPPLVKEGDWVRAEMDFTMSHPTAKIVEHIGPELPAKYDIAMVSGEFNLEEHHSFQAVKEAESFRLEVPGKDEANRTDLRHLPFMTIDGEKARDFDDAVYVEKINNERYRLWVAIADVSYYVKPGTALDAEAFKRATSVYFPERAFHMLPRALSEELCSLKPNVPRLSMAVSMEIDLDGHKSQIQIYDAIIESRRRATYTEIFEEKDDPKHAELYSLYRILRKHRQVRGSIDFEFPESEMILDEATAEPVDCVVRHRNDAHRLIEEFMIAANEAVTEWAIEKKLPFVYRIHEEPSPESMMKFAKLSKNLGAPFLYKGGTPRPKVLAEFISALKDKPAEPVLGMALLRSMRQAIYSATYGEHYGLASTAYTHFTSPIRRYPDLMVHRILRAALHQEKLGKDYESMLEESCGHCSFRERVASEADREANRFKQVRLMGKHLGEIFEGKVIGMNDKGFFVQILHPFVEGMVPLASIGDDFYEYQEAKMMIVGRRKKRMFTIGQMVRILVTRVDFDARQIEFELAGR